MRELRRRKLGISPLLIDGFADYEFDVKVMLGIKVEDWTDETCWQDLDESYRKMDEEEGWYENLDLFFWDII